MTDFYSLNSEVNAMYLKQITQYLRAPVQIKPNHSLTEVPKLERRGFLKATGAIASVASFAGVKASNAIKATAGTLGLGAVLGRAENAFSAYSGAEPNAPGKELSARFSYDPSAQYPVKVFEVPFRTNAAGRQLMARIYRPVLPDSMSSYQTPTVLDLHGGAWNAKNRTAEEPMDRALAASGILVVAIDLTLAGEAPYPANVQDANYGVRWLKKNAPLWGGSPKRVGVYGSSSGGHVAELLGMRPHDPRYNAYPLEGDREGLDARIAYIATRSPISNPFARYQNALNLKREKMMLNHTTYFKPWESIHESNPQEILERGEPVDLTPLLVMQGALDDNVLPSIQERFINTYKSVGGTCEYRVFPDSEHEWVAKEGEQTNLARECVKAFIAKQLA